MHKLSFYFNFNKINIILSIALLFVISINDLFTCFPKFQNYKENGIVVFMLFFFLRIYAFLSNSLRDLQEVPRIYSRSLCHSPQKELRENRNQVSIFQSKSFQGSYFPLLLNKNGPTVRIIIDEKLIYFLSWAGE